MTPHVIIEGPDGAGKTSLARRLCREHRMAYHHEGPPPERGVLQHYAGLLANATRPTVFDRLHLGELVYGPLLRGGSALDDYAVTLMDRVVRGLGTNIIICQPPLDTCLDNNRRKKELIEDELLRVRAWSAWQHSTHGRVNLRTYDYTLGRYPPAPLDYTSCPPGVIGSPTATILFVGEQPNGPLDLPFFGEGHCSRWLFHRIREAGLTNEEHLAFTNALDPQGRKRDLGFILASMPSLRTVVALGKVAFALCTTLEAESPVPWVTVKNLPHPQYWKQFRNSPQDYVDLIKEATDVSQPVG